MIRFPKIKIVSTAYTHSFKCKEEITKLKKKIQEKGKKKLFPHVEYDIEREFLEELRNIVATRNYNPLIKETNNSNNFYEQVR